VHVELIHIRQTLGGKSFDYFLLDTQMPGRLDGLAIAKLIRSRRSPMPGAPQESSIILMLSSTVQRTIIEEHADLAISVYLNKPVGDSELLQALLKPYRAAAGVTGVPGTQNSQALEQGASHISNKGVEPGDPTQLGQQPLLRSSHPGSAVGRITRPARILLAEDNIVNQRIAIRALERLGLEVRLTINPCPCPVGC
jgi:CheY-like chemotaxis protein